MRLKIVKEETGYSNTDMDKEISVMMHDVKVLKEFISPWLDYGRLVCTYFYFEPVQAA